MHKTFMTIALASTFLAAPGVLAQTVDPACMMKNADGTETVDMAKCPDGKTMGTSADQTGAAAPAPAPDATATTEVQKTGAGGVIIMPEAFANTKIVSANDVIGKTVYSSNNENIGEVNDLIMSDNGKIRAVILGVGGFLGMGEKEVAVDMASVNMTPEGNSVKLMLNATKEQLTSAPQYDRATRNYMQN